LAAQAPRPNSGQIAREDLRIAIASSAVGCRASSEHGEPIPKRFLVVEAAYVADHADERFLQGLARSFLISPRADDEVAKEPRKVLSVEFSKCALVTRRHPAGQQGNRGIARKRWLPA
jgi:hypothetical protein